MSRVAGRTNKQVKDYQDLLLEFYTNNPDAISSMSEQTRAYLDDDMYKLLYKIYKSYYNDADEKVASGFFGTSMQNELASSKIASDVSNVGDSILKAGSELTRPVRDKAYGLYRHYVGGLQRKLAKKTYEEDYSQNNGIVRFMNDTGILSESTDPDKVKAVYGGPQVYEESDEGGADHFKTADEWEALQKLGLFENSKLFLASFPVKGKPGHYQFRAGTLDEIRAMEGYSKNIKLDPFVTTNGYGIGLIDGLSFPVLHSNVDSLLQVNNTLNDSIDFFRSLDLPRYEQIKDSLRTEYYNARDLYDSVYNNLASKNAETYIAKIKAALEYLRTHPEYTPLEALRNYRDSLYVNASNNDYTWPSLLDSLNYHKVDDYFYQILPARLKNNSLLRPYNNRLDTLSTLYSAYSDSVSNVYTLQINPLQRRINANEAEINKNGLSGLVLHTVNGEEIPMHLLSGGTAYELLKGKSFFFGPTGKNNLFTYNLGEGVSPEMLDSINTELKARPKYLYTPDNGSFDGYIDENDTVHERSTAGYTNINSTYYDRMNEGKVPVYMEYYTPAELLRK